MANTPNLGLYKPNRNDNTEVDTSLAQNFEVIDVEVNGVKGRLTAVEQGLTEVSTSQVEASQKAQVAIDTADDAIARVTVVEQSSGVSVTENDKTITVGADGQFTTINEALAFLSPSYPRYKKQGVNVEIQLQAGFTMTEQVIVDGIDLGWITIRSVDAVVPINRDSMTLALIENRKPAFFATNKGVLPVIGCLFEFTTGEAGSLFDGIAVAYGSKVQLLPGAGVNKADRGLGVYYGSEAFCYMDGLTLGGQGTGAGEVKGVSFQDCLGRALMVSYGSRANLARAQLQRSQGDVAVYVIWNSTADLYQSDASYALNTAFHARDASTLNVRESHASNSKRGYHALHNARINARFYANQWSLDGAKNCSEYGVLASYNSQIDATMVPLDGCSTGLMASNASSITYTDGGSAKNCGIGIAAVGASMVDASDANVTGCTVKGFSVQNGSTINAENAIADNCPIGFFAERASTINARGATAKTCTTYGFQAFESCNIMASFSDATGSGVGYTVGRGSSIAAHNAVGGSLSTTKNVLTTVGVIYQ
jgi:hypothetical protein